MAYKRISPQPIVEGGTQNTTFNTDGVAYYDGTMLNSTTVGTSGQVLTSNGAGMAPTFASAAAPIDQVNVQTFTMSGTYTPTANMEYCTIEVVGGGGGGGASTTTGAAQVSGGGSGGGGGYGRKTVSAATIGASQSVTVGAGGSAGTAPGGNGGTGGTSSVGSIVSATGGSGGTGQGAGSSFNQNGATGGIGSSGDLNGSGAAGQVSFGSAALYIFIGTAGKSIFGGGGPSLFATSGTSVGNAGVNYGGGGSGAITWASQTQQNGGAGAQGIVIITEYIH